MGPASVVRALEGYPKSLEAAVQLKKVIKEQKLQKVKFGDEKKHRKLEDGGSILIFLLNYITAEQNCL